MNQNQQIEVNAEEIGQRWGQRLTQADIAIITLEKQLAIQSQFIQKMTANEAQLVERIQNLEEELMAMKKTAPQQDGLVLADIQPLQSAK
ncbi:MAG: hypothetical protein GY743_23405 [Planctomycetaceae bacterium]|nr:hypothetical protein [Planctomycetaceae bacterium]